MTMVKSEPRRQLGADLNKMQASLTNGLIKWQKVACDIENIQDRLLQLQCQKMLDTLRTLTPKLSYVLKEEVSEFKQKVL